MSKKEIEGNADFDVQISDWKSVKKSQKFPFGGVENMKINCKYFPLIKRNVNKCKYNCKSTKKQHFSLKNKTFFNKFSKISKLFRKIYW